MATCRVIGSLLSYRVLGGGRSRLWVRTNIFAGPPRFFAVAGATKRVGRGRAKHAHGASGANRSRHINAGPPRTRRLRLGALATRVSVTRQLNGHPAGNLP